jgi:hypothetical protein
MDVYMKVIIVGMNPARPSNAKKTALTRLYDWLDAVDLRFVSFTNLHTDPNWDFNLKDVDRQRLVDHVQGYDKVIALGGMVSNYLTKYIHVEHLKIAHPSYRNRSLNCPVYEANMLDNLRTYLND